MQRVRIYPDEPGESYTACAQMAHKLHAKGIKAWVFGLKPFELLVYKKDEKRARLALGQDVSKL